VSPAMVEMGPDVWDWDLAEELNVLAVDTAERFDLFVDVAFEAVVRSSAPALAPEYPLSRYVSRSPLSTPSSSAASERIYITETPNAN
jgi:hypothetical protein